NILRGIPINEQGNFTGSFIDLLNPYSILIGLLSLAMFIMHGAIYLTTKSEGELRNRMVKLISKIWTVFILLYVIATFVSLFEAPYLFDGILNNPFFWILFILLLGSVLYLPVAIKGAKYFLSFILSSLTIASIIGLSAVSLFPRLVPSNINLNYSLTIYNSSSSQRTLMTMFIIALIGMPIVIAYTIFIYRVFKGKVVISKESY
ncbi:MAG: cytochrome d ubiquinol oxidase subunit II, partial [Bacteroidetes bacterium]|nr:cytochrome d ubiquinol oxidase subunit II [Bacteroidota bacterium]